MWQSFDGYLQNMAEGLGANIVNARVEQVLWENDKPQVHLRNQEPIE